MIVAQFKDEAAKKAHEDGDHLAAQRAKFADVLAGPPVRNVYQQIWGIQNLGDSIGTG